MAHNPILDVIYASAPRPFCIKSRIAVDEDLPHRLSLRSTASHPDRGAAKDLPALDPVMQRLGLFERDHLGHDRPHVAARHDRGCRGFRVPSPSRCQPQA